MAGRKLKPVEGDVCWFCKQPADSESWMGLGELKSTQEPVFEETHYILYHEPCAVYSNGAEVSFMGMDDQTVLQFWLHGERCSGIGLKCQLCGLRLPHPAEDEFQGMWMEGEGGWNGMYKQQAAVTWQPRYASHLAAFQARWQHLLTMTPHDQLKAQQQQEKKKNKRRRSSRGGRTAVDGGDSDPEFRVGKPVRTSNTGGRGRGGHQRQKQQSATRSSSAGESTERQQQQQHAVRQSPLPERIGVLLEVAEAVEQQARSADSVPGTATAAAAGGPESGAVEYTSTEQGHSGSSEQLQPRHAAAEQQQGQRQSRRIASRKQNGGVVLPGKPVLDPELLLKAAGFITTTSETTGQAQQQDDSSIQLPQHVTEPPGAASGDHAPAAAAAAADRGGSGDHAVHKVPRAATSSADSAAPARKRAKLAVADAPAGTADTSAAAPVANDDHEVASKDDEVQVASAVGPTAEDTDAPVCAAASASPDNQHGDQGESLDATADAVDSQLPAQKDMQQHTAAATASTPAAAAALPEAPESALAAGKEHDGNTQGSAGAAHKGRRTTAAAAAAGGSSAKTSARGGRKRRPAATVPASGEHTEAKTVPPSRLDVSGRGHAPAAVQCEQPGLAAVSPSAVGSTAATPAAIPASSLPGWPANRGLDMFSWLQEQVKQQQSQQQQQVQQQDAGQVTKGLEKADGPGSGMQLMVGDAKPYNTEANAAAQAPVSRSNQSRLPPTDALQQAAAAAAKLAPSLEKGQQEKLLSVLRALEQAAQGQHLGSTTPATAAVARESALQLPLAKQPSLPVGRTSLSASAALPPPGTSDSTVADHSALVPAIAELLKVLGAQLSSRKSLQDIQQRPVGLARPIGMDQYGGIEAANAAAAAAATAGSSSYPRSPIAAAAAMLGPPGASRLLPRMPEYFGCVTAVPALQPGELRAAGVTAHPNVVSAYVKQNLKTALTLQPWSIVIPPSTLKQLRSSQIEPSHLASQLYQLLHASNVMNHHSTNATVASGLAGLGMMPVSGGYAGMPQDFPVRFVQGCMVPDDDARAGLPGEFALRAIQDIEVGTIIGPWRCYMMMDEDYKRLQRSVPTDWQCAGSECKEQAWHELLHRYTLSVRVPFLATDDPYGKVLASNPPLLHLCALGFGNLTCLVNDPVLDPTSGAAATEPEQTVPPNVELCMVLVNGLPLPVLISIKQVQRGQELCCSYGTSYWQIWCKLKAAAAAAAAAVTG